MKTIDLTGQNFGYLRVISREGSDKYGQALWLYQCTCGKRVVVRGQKLRSGHTKSCGCYQRARTGQSNRKDLTNKTFGLLTAIEPTGNTDSNRNAIWKCKCQCGNTIEVNATSLLTGNTKSCGCLQSWMEKEIATYLRNHNIAFKQQYSFTDLVDKLPLRFEFAIFKNNQLIGLIEYQGEQHYIKENPYWSETLEQHDKAKKEYCFKNNIPFLELTKKINIEEKLEEFIYESSNIQLRTMPTM